MFNAVITTPIGILGLTCKTDKLTGLHFLDKRIVPIPYASLSARIKKIVKKIEAFFSCPQPLADIPHLLNGTPFQQQAWAAISTIPVGQTLTYGELAWELRTSARAIGMACRTNPLPLIVPCHRVVAANSDGGFCGKTTGDMVAIKRWLLAHERGTC